jgi:hypothetical protein
VFVAARTSVEHLKRMLRYHSPGREDHQFGKALGPEKGERPYDRQFPEAWARILSFEVGLDPKRFDAFLIPELVRWENLAAINYQHKTKSIVDVSSC